jgi:hypothetical protein
MRLLSALLILAMTATSALSADGPLRHIVSFKFKAGTSPDAIRKIETAFAALPSKIQQIQSFEWGTDVSEEGLAKGFTHLWVLHFANKADLKTYIDHPDHVAFVAQLKPILEDAFVVDFHPTK